jgi:hypothetical protein
MTGTEERLAQALRARTDLITHDRLTPSAPPVAAKPRSPLRRPAFALLAAAACAAAIALPFALAGGDGQKPDPVGPTTARPTSAPVAPSPTMTVSAVPDPALPPFASENAASTILPGEAARLADNRWGIETLSMPAVDPAADVLMVSWADGSAAQIDLPDEGDWVPQASTTLVTGDSPGVLVTWEQRDGAIQRVYSTAGHRLAEIVPQSAFGLNASEDGGNPRSVLGLDGTIYTSVEPDDARGVKILIYEWSAGDENLLLANGGRSTGTWCLVDEPVTWRRC